MEQKLKFYIKDQPKLNDDIVLTDVLHVPDFCFKLISVLKLCEDLNCQVSFTNKGCLLQGLAQNRPPILLGSSFNGLYRNSIELSASSDSQQCHTTTVTANEEDSKIWHLRMGHQPF